MNEEIIEGEELVPNANNMIMIAERLAKSRMFPNIINAEQALAVIEYGRELYLPPVISLQTIVPIKGKLCVESKVYQALLERNGIKITVIEKSRERCILKFEKKGKEPYKETFTLDDAKRAGLASKDNFIKYTETMLYYRCMSKGAKVYSPGSCLGLYTTDEMEEVEDKKKRKVGGKPKAEKAEEVKPIEHEPIKTEKAEPEEVKPKEKTKEKKKEAPKELKTEKEKKEHIKKSYEFGMLDDSVTSDGTIENQKEKETELVEEPGQGTSEEMAETIQEDFKIRFGKKWREKYKEFKHFLLEFQKERTPARKFVNVNEHGRLSISLGVAEDIILMWKNLPFTLMEWTKWQKKREEETEKEGGGNDSIPF